MSSDAELDALRQLGRVTQVVVPNSFHYVFTEAFMSHWPRAQLFLPPGFFERLDTLSNGTELGAAAPPGWPAELEYQILQPSNEVSELALFHAPSRSLILTDLAFNIRQFPRGVDGPVWRMFGIPSEFGHARTSRMVLLRDRDIAKAFLEQVLEWPFERIIVSHGDVVEQDAKGELRRAFARYLA